MSLDLATKTSRGDFVALSRWSFDQDFTLHVNRFGASVHIQVSNSDLRKIGKMIEEAIEGAK